MTSELESAKSDENGEISSGNYINYGFNVDSLRELAGDYASKRAGLSELRLAPDLTEKLQNDPTEPAKQALNGRGQPVNGARPTERRQRKRHGY
jgi:hypothetical protein